MRGDLFFHAHLQKVIVVYTLGPVSWVLKYILVKFIALPVCFTRTLYNFYFLREGREIN